MHCVQRIVVLNMRARNSWVCESTLTRPPQLAQLQGLQALCACQAVTMEGDVAAAGGDAICSALQAGPFESAATVPRPQPHSYFMKHFQISSECPSTSSASSDAWASSSSALASASTRASGYFAGTCMPRDGWYLPCRCVAPECCTR